MFDVTSETRDITSVIILKSRASLMTPSLIEDIARP